MLLDMHGGGLDIVIGLTDLSRVDALLRLLTRACNGFCAPGLHSEESHELLTDGRSTRVEAARILLTIGLMVLVALALVLLGKGREISSLCESKKQDSSNPSKTLVFPLRQARWSWRPRPRPGDRQI
ncbi:hypothetical protein HYQ44_017741 [Verticillium longisporum]|nr:hypothetical protein HYQ44_017741 [Verticillium longisporum]